MQNWTEMDQWVLDAYKNSKPVYFGSFLNNIYFTKDHKKLILITKYLDLTIRVNAENYDTFIDANIEDLFDDSGKLKDIIILDIYSMTTSALDADAEYINPNKFNKFFKLNTCYNLIIEMLIRENGVLNYKEVKVNFMYEEFNKDLGLKVKYIAPSTSVDFVKGD